MKNKKIKILTLSLALIAMLTSCNESDKSAVEESSSQSKSENVSTSVSQSTSEEISEPVSQSGNVMDDVVLGSMYTETDGKKDVCIKYYKGTDSVVVITQPEGQTIRCVLGSAFYGNESIKEVTLPETVEYIDSETFGMCKNLEKVDLGDGIKKIGKNAFLQCAKLKFVDLGEKIELIDEAAFSCCFELEEIIIPTTCVDISVSAFALVAENFTIKGEKGSYAEEYAKANNIPFVEYQFN